MSSAFEVFGSGRGAVGVDHPRQRNQRLALEAFAEHRAFDESDGLLRVLVASSDWVADDANPWYAFLVAGTEILGSSCGTPGSRSLSRFPGLSDELARAGGFPSRFDTVARMAGFPKLRDTLLQTGLFTRPELLAMINLDEPCRKALLAVADTGPETEGLLLARTGLTGPDESNAVRALGDMGLLELVDGGYLTSVAITDDGRWLRDRLKERMP